MVNPQFVEEHSLSLVAVKDVLDKMAKRDVELNYRSSKAREFLGHFVSQFTLKQREELCAKLKGLELTRLKDEHINKIVDFLPKTSDELKAIFAGYPLSLSKKDLDAIVDVVKGCV